MRAGLSSRVRAVGVVVPARDEEQRIGSCLMALRAAFARLPPGVAAGICVVLDRCQDATESVIRHTLGAAGPWPELDVVVNRSVRSVGELRNHGMRQLMRRLSPVPAGQTWLLSTDADSTVPASWTTDHLRYAEAGADAVAGMVGLDDPGRLHPDALRRYASVVEANTAGGRHEHAYAANLGVCAQAYHRVGGFPRVRSGEEHGLLARLHAAGYRIARPTDVRVCTSARLRGRAQGGLADLLRHLHHDVPQPPAR